MALTYKVTAVLIMCLVSLHCFTNARPLSSDPDVAERTRRQTLGNPERYATTMGETEICPIFVDGQCDKIQDFHCARQQIKEIQRVSHKNSLIFMHCTCILVD